MVTKVKIYPPEMDNFFNIDPDPVLFFSFPLMTEYHVIQQFKRDNSYIYFKNLPRSQNNKFRFHKCCIRIKMPPSSQPDRCTNKIVIDSGADKTFVSRLYLKRLGLEKRPPQTLRIHMGGDVYLQDELSVHPNPDEIYPFTIGTDVFEKYECILDASAFQLFFNVNNNTYMSLLT